MTESLEVLDMGMIYKLFLLSAGELRILVEKATMKKKNNKVKVNLVHGWPRDKKETQSPIK